MIAQNEVNVQQEVANKTDNHTSHISIVQGGL